MSGMPDAAPDALSDSTVSPWATRLRRARWTDPRLIVGLLLVAVATVAGVRLLDSSDDTAPVWATAGAVRAGDPVQATDLVVSRVRIGDGSDEATYLPAGEAPPEGVFVRDLAAGELVPMSAVGEQAGAAGADLPLSVELGDAPADLAAGDLVDVWAVPAEAGAAGASGAPAGAAERVLAAVTVLEVTDPAAALGGSTRQVLLRLDPPADDLGDPLARLVGGTVVLVRVGG